MLLLTVLAPACSGDLPSGHSLIECPHPRGSRPGGLTSLLYWRFFYQKIDYPPPGIPKRNLFPDVRVPSNAFSNQSRRIAVGIYLNSQNRNCGRNILHWGKILACIFLFFPFLSSFFSGEGGSQRCIYLFCSVVFFFISQLESIYLINGISWSLRIKLKLTLFYFYYNLIRKMGFVTPSHSIQSPGL